MISFISARAVRDLNSLYLMQHLAQQVGHRQRRPSARWRSSVQAIIGHNKPSTSQLHDKNDRYAAPHYNFPEILGSPPPQDIL
ncbi:hypothetical protein NDU88_004937 [Pleurodeles waltl]|uniref:Uncharacterized protein n=1 Tax=Pleurodeles waltl TaxID=8319 RepID=A0AAV7W858_PLEWA|nr:hypothetical protein NDU88_004937 [Pleurodeles waltl]